MRNEGCSQAITCCLSCSFLLIGREHPSHSSLASMVNHPPWAYPAWVISTGFSSSWAAPAWVSSMGCRPSETGCSSMSPPWDDKSHEQTCSSVSFSQGHSLLWPSSYFSGGSSKGCRWISAPTWTSMGSRGTAASPWSSPWAAEESLLWCLGHPPLHPPVLLHWPGCLQDGSSHVFSLLISLTAVCFCTITFFPLNLLFQRHSHCSWQVFHGQQWIHPGAGWCWLCQIQRRPPAASQRSHPGCHPFYQTLAMQTLYDGSNWEGNISKRKNENVPVIKDN